MTLWKGGMSMRASAKAILMDPTPCAHLNAVAMQEDERLATLPSRELNRRQLSPTQNACRADFAPLQHDCEVKTLTLVLHTPGLDAVGKHGAAQMDMRDL